MAFTHSQQPTGQDRFVRTLDFNHLGLAERRYAINQPGRGRRKHHATRRSDRFHPLRHAHLLTNSGITKSARTDFTGDHLARVQAHPQPQLHTVAVYDIDRKPVRLLLNSYRGKTSADCVVLHCNRCAEHRHDPVAGELIHRASVPLHHRGAAVGKVGHDLAQPLRTHRRRDVHRMHHIGEQHRHLLVLSRLGGLRESRTALTTELGCRAQLSAARVTGRSHRCQGTAAIPTKLHVNMVSPLLRQRVSYRLAIRSEAAKHTRRHRHHGCADPLRRARAISSSPTSALVETRVWLRFSRCSACARWSGRLPTPPGIQSNSPALASRLRRCSSGSGTGTAATSRWVYSVCGLRRI